MSKQEEPIAFASKIRSTEAKTVSPSIVPKR